MSSATGGGSGGGVVSEVSAADGSRGRCIGSHPGSVARKARMWRNYDESIGWVRFDTYGRIAGYSGLMTSRWLVT
jgi:hypothetical protein